MRVPLDWLGEYVDLAPGVRGADVAAALVKVGLEEEGLHGGDLTGPLVVGKVLTQDPEPQKNGKVINWCTVDVGDANGTGEPQGIVCGAHNFGVGDFVVVVLPGAVLPGGFAIAARKTYGHVSAGMICAADELGLPDDGSGGIIRLAERLPGVDLTPGQDAIALLGLDRETVEINVTPDRGYCFSLRGVAREYSHATGAKFTDPVTVLAQRAPAAGGAGFPVRLADEAPIRDRVGCSRYVARIVRGIDPSAPSPAWLATRLTEAGMRPISLPVDVTNYVMLALGQPLHAFDLATLNGGITVRRAAPGETLKTLDGVERKLFEEDLVIADDQRAIAIAGTMGGEATEVTDATTDILIEAARFDQTTVARSARRHKLPSEAAKRFERGVDPEIAAAAAQFAVELLVEHGGGHVDDGVTDVQLPLPQVVIDFDPADAGRLVGVPYPATDVIDVLRQIGCTVDGSGDTLHVTPPSWRPDLTTGPDLIEEVARIRGYEQIPSILPTPPGGRGLTHGQQVRRLVANVLAARGFDEVWSAPFVGDDVHEAFGWDPEQARARTVALVNPLSDEQPLFRISLLTTMVEVLRRNVSRGFSNVALFEIGLVAAIDGPLTQAPYSPVGVHPCDEVLAAIRGSVPPQPRHLAFLLTGNRTPAGWAGAGRPADWTDTLETVQAIGEALAVPLTVTPEATAPFHPGRSGRVTAADGTFVGHVGELHPKTLQRLGLPPRVVGGQLLLDELIRLSEATPQATALSVMPMADSDVALLVDTAVSAAAVETALREGAGELLESIELFDVYEGERIEAGKKSLAYRLVFRAPDRTLKTEEVNAFRDAAVARAADAVGAVQR